MGRFFGVFWLCLGWAAPGCGGEEEALTPQYGCVVSEAFTQAKDGGCSGAFLCHDATSSAELVWRVYKATTSGPLELGCVKYTPNKESYKSADSYAATSAKGVCPESDNRTRALKVQSLCQWNSFPISAMSF